MRSIALVSVALALLLLQSGQPTTPCGTFRFYPRGPDPHRPEASSVAKMSLFFRFDPAPCGGPGAATANEIPYLQIARFVDFQNHVYRVPEPLTRLWAVDDPADPEVDGWFVDNSTGQAGYYGQQSTGGYSSFVTLGDMHRQARMRDTPSAPSATRFQAIAAPVCTRGDASCLDHLLGLYAWTFDESTVASGAPPAVMPTATRPVGTIATTEQWDLLTSAVDAWNCYVGTNQSANPAPFPTLLRWP